MNIKRNIHFYFTSTKKLDQRAIELFNFRKPDGIDRKNANLITMQKTVAKTNVSLQTDEKI